MSKVSFLMKWIDILFWMIKSLRYKHNNTHLFIGCFKYITDKY